MIQTLILDPFTPQSVNEFLKRSPGLIALARRRKRSDCAIVHILALNQGITKATAKRRVSIDVTLAGRGRLPDPDNLLKPLLDHLVKCKLLVDDAPKWCEIGTVQVQHGAKSTVAIRLEDVE